jgi:hypothetical protein
VQSFVRCLLRVLCWCSVVESTGRQLPKSMHSAAIFSDGVWSHRSIPSHKGFIFVSVGKVPLAAVSYWLLCLLSIHAPDAPYGSTM